MKKIILYGLSEERKNRIQQVLDSEIKIKFIDKSHLSTIVGDLFDSENITPAGTLEENTIFDNEFMLIEGFDTDDDLRDLLFAFKSNLVARPITSARTETNEKWILKDLLIEIFEEHEFMTNQNK